MNCEGTSKQSCTESLGIFSWNLRYLEKYGKDAQWPDGSAAGFSHKHTTSFLPRSTHGHKAGGCELSVLFMPVRSPTAEH